jgi:hypothetical protein
MEVGGSKPLGLYKAEVTSRRWRVSGVRIGDSKAKVLRRFGRVDEFKEKGKHYLRYWIKDGWSNFYFNRNRLRAVAWESNFC